MTRAERNLAERGKEEFVLEMRHAFQETMREDLTAAVERLTGRKVVAFLSANHIEPDVAAEVFVLDESVAETEEVPGFDSPARIELNGPGDGIAVAEPSPGSRVY